jgi:coenzyme F420-0:L-glutamate ligase/coenzyme F420-1:gamma-L-glutamate ligase
MAGSRKVSEAISSRRSVRHFKQAPVLERTVADLVALACAAPAPHHSRPWRFAHIASPEIRTALADAMADSWRADLDEAGTSVREIDRLLGRSRAQIEEAPALLIACLAYDEAKYWPNERRQRAERDMFVQSLGAALQNVLLAAGERGLVGYIKGAPLFCSDAVAQAALLPEGWEPAFLILLGYPPEGYEPTKRTPIDPADYLVER